MDRDEHDLTPPQATPGTSSALRFATSRKGEESVPEEIVVDRARPGY
jgi:hypothetical protein